MIYTAIKDALRCDITIFPRHIGEQFLILRDMVLLFDDLPAFKTSDTTVNFPLGLTSGPCRCGQTLLYDFFQSPYAPWSFHPGFGICPSYTKQESAHDAFLIICRQAWNCIFHICFSKKRNQHLFDHCLAQFVALGKWSLPTQT